MVVRRGARRPDLPRYVWGMWRFFFTLCLCLSLAAPLRATELHCIGTDRFFNLLMIDDEARFDYLGDGRFDLAPPLPQELPDFLRFSLMTYGGPIPVYLERTACPVEIGTTVLQLEFRVELGIDSSIGIQPMRGCCLLEEPRP